MHWHHLDQHCITQFLQASSWSYLIEVVYYYLCYFMYFVQDLYFLFCWSEVLLPVCPCWWQLKHLDYREHAGVFFSSVACAISIPFCYIVAWRCVWCWIFMCNSCSCFQEYLFPLARDREYLITMHRKAKRLNFDVETYNRLQNQLFQVQTDLKRLRDPIDAHLRLPYLPPKPHNQNGCSDPWYPYTATFTRLISTLWLGLVLVVTEFPTFSCRLHGGYVFLSFPVAVRWWRCVVFSVYIVFDWNASSCLSAKFLGHAARVYGV